MLGYFVFNVLLYSTQTMIYSLLFIPEIDQVRARLTFVGECHSILFAAQTVQTNVIYITLAAFNVFLPIFWCLVYISLTIQVRLSPITCNHIALFSSQSHCQFSGFPYSTPDAKVRLSSLNWLGIVWSLSRLAWGSVALTSVVHGWLTEAEKSKTYYTVFMVSAHVDRLLFDVDTACLQILLFLLTEVLPILFSLQRNLIQRLSEKNLDVTISDSSREASASNTGYGPGAVMASGNRSNVSCERSVKLAPCLSLNVRPARMHSTMPRCRCSPRWGAAAVSRTATRRRTWPD